MNNIVRLKAHDGSDVEVDYNKPAGSGGMKDVYFSPDRSYVVAFFRKPQDYNSEERIKKIVTDFHDKIFNQVGGDYWRTLFRWPVAMVKHNNLTGIKVPVYEKEYFFEFGSRNNDMLGIKGKEKEGKWFASANHQQKHLDPRERGDWMKYLAICIKIARATRRMHAAGLAHSDLSYKNVLVDPRTGGACLIDIDGLVVPGRFPPDVLGTPDFIAPEVLRTVKLPMNDQNRKLPNRTTDQHALAVLIYMYLLYRHPLRGGKVHDTSDPQRDDELMMGERALFVEHPTDASNRPNPNDHKPSAMPFADVSKIPYRLVGPYLKELFDRAFVSGLHNPMQRPIAGEWETALIKTVDLVQPCANPKCDQKFFVFDNTTKPTCPFCGTPFRGDLPMLNLYSSDGKGNFRPDNHRLMVYHQQNIYQWHSNRNVVPNERLPADQRKPVADFHIHGGKWIVVNRSLPGMKDVTNNKPIPPNSHVELTEGLQLLLDPSEGGRLAHIQLVKA